MNRTQARDNLARVIRKTVDFLADSGLSLTPDLLTWRSIPDAFSVRGAGRPGAKTKEAQAVNAYTETLQREYKAWAEDLAYDLEDADEDEHDDIIRDALAALLLLLKKHGQEALPQAMTLGLDGHLPDGDIMQLLSDAMDENDNFLKDSLIPDIGQKIRNAFLDDDVKQALASGAGAAALSGVLNTMLGRVGNYAGAFWKLYNESKGEVARDNEFGVRWNLDDRAHHCEDCLEYGDTTYDSYDDLLSQTGGVTPANGTACGDGCRCWLEWIGE